MLTPEQAEAMWLLRQSPLEYAHLLGFTKLTALHQAWIKDMVEGVGDRTQQGHRGSYKTTSVVIALVIIMILFPNAKIAFFRKTDNDVKEIIRQARRILEHEVTREIVRRIWGVALEITKATANEITTNLTNDPRGTAQLTGMGIGGSVTGKHFDQIFTDDIVNVADRISRAERERTKLFYQELQNLRNRGGRIFNTGTPWHEEDAFSIMPEPVKYDCYSTGLISAAELEQIKRSMLPSLFAANYELRHIASEDVIFVNPQTGAAPAKLNNANMCHIDASYGGEDYTAFTIVKKADGKIYVLGMLWHDHFLHHIDEMIRLRKQYRAGPFYMESNADRGYVAKEMRSKGETAIEYVEDMNKFVKISTYLYEKWENVVFVRGTDETYIKQVCDYTQDAEHDDAPDSLAVCVRKLFYTADEGKRTPGLLRHGLVPA